MNEIGPLDEAILSVVRLEDGRWIVRFAEVDVEIEHDEATNRLMFSTLVAPVPASRRDEVHEALLLYSMAWRETGGIRMALNGPGGAVVQMGDVFAPDATAKTVVTVVRNIAEKCLAWRSFVEAQVPAGDDRARFSASHDHSMIRA